MLTSKELCLRICVCMCVSWKRVRHEMARSVYLRCLPMPVMPLYTGFLAHTHILISQCLCSLLLMRLDLSSHSTDAEWERERPRMCCGVYCTLVCIFSMVSTCLHDCNVTWVLLCFICLWYIWSVFICGWFNDWVVLSVSAVLSPSEKAISDVGSEIFSPITSWKWGNFRENIKWWLLDAITETIVIK